MVSPTSMPIIKTFTSGVSRRLRLRTLSSPTKMMAPIALNRMLTSGTAMSMCVLISISKSTLAPHRLRMP